MEFLLCYQGAFLGIFDIWQLHDSFKEVSDSCVADLGFSRRDEEHQLII